MKSMLVSSVKSLYLKMPILKTILIYCIFTLSDIRTGNMDFKWLHGCAADRSFCGV